MSELLDKDEVLKTIDEAGDTGEALGDVNYNCKPVLTIPDGATRADVFELIYGIRPWNGDGHNIPIPVTERRGVGEWWDNYSKSEKQAHIQRENDNWWNSPYKQEAGKDECRRS